MWQLLIIEIVEAEDPWGKEWREVGEDYIMRNITTYCLSDQINEEGKGGHVAHIKEMRNAFRI
jgi:hypothetical protein